MKAAGLEEEITLDGRPPIVRYVTEGSTVVEFITPRQGGAVRRDGSARIAQQIAGVGAVCLLDIELLLHEPWEVVLGGALRVRVANPTSFIVHKLLTMKARRNVSKRPKDLLYVHDTLLAFGGALPELREIWRRLFPLVRRGARTILRGQVARFERIDELAQGASLIAGQQRGDAPTPEQVRAVCHRGLAEVFGDDL